MQYNAENDEQSKYASTKSTPQELSPEMTKFLEELCKIESRPYYDRILSKCI